MTGSHNWLGSLLSRKNLDQYCWYWAASRSGLEAGKEGLGVGPPRGLGVGPPKLGLGVADDTAPSWDINGCEERFVPAASLSAVIAAAGAVVTSAMPPVAVEPDDDDDSWDMSVSENILNSLSQLVVALLSPISWD